MADSAYAIVLFDGVCNLCNRSVQFIIERDRARYFRFASLQSALADSLLQRHGLANDALTTLVLAEGGELYVRSTAALRIAGRLTPAWRWLSRAGWWLPAPWRDAIYRLIARNRYRWFGRREHCWVPSPELKALFLDHP